MASRSDPNDESASYALGQIVAGVLTAQNSCPVHEACDSSCPRRIDVHRYRLMPDGEKRDRVDQRAQLAAIRPNSRSLARTQPLVIREGVPQFVHEPLVSPGSMIRLLRIKPRLFRADPVDCELVHFHMNQAPAYGALSYYWGSPPDDIKLLCNGKVFYGRASLERALKRLRAGFKTGQREEFIWADAICINQKDLAEKDAQVRFMEQIYSKATTVYVDLGETQGQSVSLGGFTLQFSSMNVMGTQDLLTESDQQRNPLHHKTAFQALTHPWFTRTWIIQEAALAQNLKYMANGTVFT